MYLKNTVFGFKAKYIPIHFLDELGLPKSYGNEMSLNDGARIINQYIGFNDSVLEEVQNFYSKYFHGNSVIGIHYRGTDKIGEAPQVQYEKVVNTIAFAMKKDKNLNILFVSSDDQNFINYLSTKIKNIPIVWRDDYSRSSDNTAVHLNSKLNKNEVNRDAVINLILLSKCNFLIKTSSFLSDISKLLSPELPTVVLNRPYDWALWFPCREIIKNQAFNPEELDEYSI